MGKKSRAKRERRMESDRPRWAGAPGFDRAFRIAERYASVYPQIQEAADIPVIKVGEISREYAQELGRDVIDQQLKRCHAVRDVLGFQVDLLDRQFATISAAARAKGTKEPDTDSEADPVVLPGRALQDTDKEVASYLPYAKALAILADDHMARMREATPVVFDPLAVPDPSADALIGLGLPFPVVVADFSTTTGMSLPVQGISEGDEWWVGLVAATIVQTDEGGPVDVYPTVTTLNPDRANDAQVPRELMFGCIRFGAPMPPAPEGLQHVTLDDCEAWVVELDNPEPWTALWLRAPALAAISAMRLLDAVNVDLIDVPLARAARRRAERENAKLALMVDVRSSHTIGSDPTGNVGTIEWRQRWTVRGHWKHFGEHTRVARRHPSRVLDVPGHGRCVKVWCPPHVKGPADKPLVLKTRVVPASEMNLQRPKAQSGQSGATCESPPPKPAP